MSSQEEAPQTADDSAPQPSTDSAAQDKPTQDPEAARAESGSQPTADSSAEPLQESDLQPAKREVSVEGHQQTDNGETTAEDGVSLQSESWVPPSSTLEAKPIQRIPSQALSVISEADGLTIQCQECGSWSSRVLGSCENCGITFNRENCIDVARLSKEWAIAPALSTLRAGLKSALTQRGLGDGNQVLRDEIMLKAEGGRIEWTKAVECIESLGAHVFKKVLRPLLAHSVLANEAETFDAELLVKVINVERWWPNDEIVKDKHDEEERMRAELEEILGPELAPKVLAGQDISYIQTILGQVQKDKMAVEELKAFLGAIPKDVSSDEADGGKRNDVESPNQEPKLADASKADGAEEAGGNRVGTENEGTQEVIVDECVESKEAETSPPEPRRAESVDLLEQRVTKGGRRLSGSAFLPERSATSMDGGEWQAKAVDKIDRSIRAENLQKTYKFLKPLVSKISTKTPVIKKRYPYEPLPPKILPSHDFVWQEWQDKTGHVHAPMIIPNEDLGSSFKRRKEYHKAFTIAAAEQNKAMNHSRDFWRRRPAPSSAIEYVRWDMLEQPVPGFTPFQRISTPVHAKPFSDEGTKFPFKYGSRFADPQHGGLEKLRSTSMLTDDLKHERSKSNLVLDGTNIVKGVRLQVIKGDYDRALSDTEQALNKYLNAGKYGRAMAKEVADPLGYVVKLIKMEIDKMLKVSKEALDRQHFDKALSQIPPLREASQWLLSREVTYPEAREPTHWETRKGISKDTFPEGMAVINEVQEEIQEKELSHAQSMEFSSLVAAFSGIHPELDMEDPAHQKEIEEAEQRRNRLPKTILADGRTQMIIVDLQPPDLPEKLKLGTHVQVRGERVMGGSGKTVNAETWCRGSVVSWNQRANKYKIQYEDDFEWISWPAPFEVEIDMYPEDVTIEAPGYTLRSVTHEHPTLGQKVGVVVFTIVPQGPQYDMTIFGSVKFTVKGVKSGKSLLDEDEDGLVKVLPPEIVQPASTYKVFDSLTNLPLDGTIEFIHAEDKSITLIKNGESVQLPKDGVYSIVAKGGQGVSYPYTAFHGTCVLCEGLTRGPDSECRMHLNKHIQRSDELRVVVSWVGKMNLDSYTYTSSKDQIDYTRCGTRVNGVKFHMDNTQGFGPETVSLKVRQDMCYSFSIKFSAEEADTDALAATLAKVVVYDHSGQLAVFHIPPVRQGVKGIGWWHVFALDGAQWEKAGHGLLRVNRLSESPLPQLAVPGWTLLEAARSGMWDEFIDQIGLFAAGKVGDQPVILPRRLGTITSNDGETIIGLICSHNEELENRGKEADEQKESMTQVQKQLECLHQLLKVTVELEKRAKSADAQNGGIPGDISFEREVKIRGPKDNYIFRAVAYASVDVAVEVLNLVGSVSKRSTTGSVLKRFLFDHSDAMIDLCIQKRHPKELVMVLGALLNIEAVWERRTRKMYQEKDLVQVELASGDGSWLEGQIIKKGFDSFKVRVFSHKRGAKDACFQIDEELDDSKPVELAMDDAVVGEIVDVVPARLKWQCTGLDRARVLLHKYQQLAKSMDLSQGVSDDARAILQAEGAYKRAVSMLVEKGLE